MTISDKKEKKRKGKKGGCSHAGRCGQGVRAWGMRAGGIWGGMQVAGMSEGMCEGVCHDSFLAPHPIDRIHSVSLGLIPLLPFPTLQATPINPDYA